MTEDRRWVALPAHGDQNPDHWCSPSAGRVPEARRARSHPAVREQRTGLCSSSVFPASAPELERISARHQRPLSASTSIGRGGASSFSFAVVCVDLTERGGRLLASPSACRNDRRPSRPENAPAYHSEPAEQCFFASLVDGSVAALIRSSGSGGTYLVRARRSTGSEQLGAERLVRREDPRSAVRFREQHITTPTRTQAMSRRSSTRRTSSRSSIRGMSCMRRRSPLARVVHALVTTEAVLTESRTRCASASRTRPSKPSRPARGCGSERVSVMEALLARLDLYRDGKTRLEPHRLHLVRRHEGQRIHEP